MGTGQPKPAAGVDAPSRFMDEDRRGPAPRGAKVGGERRATLFALALLTVLSALAFANAFQNHFAFDDVPIIVRNQLIHQLRHVPHLFASTYWAGPLEQEGDLPDDLYRPLVLTTYALNYAVGGENTFGYHLLNLLFHAVVSFLLYGLARQLGTSFGGALAAAALFAVHPLHTEAVTGIVGRAEILMTLGVLLALRWYRQGGAPDKLERRYVLASLGAFAVALLSKEQAVMLPALLLISDLAAFRHQMEPRSRRALFGGAWRRYLAYVLLVGGYMALRTAVVGTPLSHQSELNVFLDNPLAHGAWNVQVFTALKVAGRYLWLFVWPLKLSADYSYNAIPLAHAFGEPGVILGVLAWGGLLGLAALSYFSGTRQVFFGIGWTVVTFFPASNLVVTIGTIMGERLFYLPSVGLCLALGAGWDQLEAWVSHGPYRQIVRRVALGLLTLVIMLLTVRTVQRNRDWRTTESLFQRAVEVVPQSAKAHYTMGAFKKDPEEALQDFEEAVRIYPEFPVIHGKFNVGRGTALLRAGRIDEAVEDLERALRLTQRHQEGLYNLGLAYAKQERWEEAEGAYRKALALNLEDADVHNSLSFVLRQQGRSQEALAAADEAIRLKPPFVEAHYNRARALEDLGEMQEAAAAYERVLELKPNLPAVKQRLEALRARLGG